MDKQKYNGWTNYETWAVALWLSNEEASYRYWREAALEAHQLCKRAEERREEAPIILADRLKEEIYESLLEGVADLASDLLSSALSEVDWLEIAEHWIADFCEEDESQKPWSGPRPAFDSDQKFPLGQTVATPGALEAIEPEEMLAALSRHHRGDWGNCCPEDWESNEEALRDGLRIFSVYHNRGREKFWIITEADRSVTTVLLPDEY